MPDTARYDEAPRFRRRRSLPLVPVVVLVVGGLILLLVALIGTGALVLRSLEPTITAQDIAQAGALILVALLVVLVVDHRVRQRSHAGAPAEAEAPSPYPPSARQQPQDEIVVTAEQWKEYRVLEYSRPPKSEHATAVYAKVLVPVDGQYVLRVEDLVAEAVE